MKAAASVMEASVLGSGAPPAVAAPEQAAAGVATLRRTRPIRGYRTPAKVLHWATAFLVIGMVMAGVMAKQLEGTSAGETLLAIHKCIGVLTFAVVVARIVYRVWRTMPDGRGQPYRRPVLHWLLYGVLVAVPLLGWAAMSDLGTREMFAGLSLPAIWPQGWGYERLFLRAHAYLAFALLALTALHIGVAIQDYMTGVRPPQRR
ncbi:MAG: cytochrome b/b6 domain-containing protein [Rhizobiales bacterium]|nr:cytochrome b/b6 domain-containing protein [Hyphomicrobiales bacterium]